MLCSSSHVLGTFGLSSEWGKCMITKCNPSVVPEIFGGVILEGIPCICGADGEGGSNQLTKY